MIKSCLSVVRTLAIHYGKGQLVPKEFEISEQNIASPGNNSVQRTVFTGSSSSVAALTHSIIRTE